MKKTLFTTIAIVLTSSLFSQQNIKGNLIPASSSELSNYYKKGEINLSTPKSITCNDTLHYPLLKETNVGSSNFYSFEIWGIDNEAISQTFYYNSSSSSTVYGAQVFGRSSPANTQPLPLIAELYMVDSNNRPTGTALAAGTLIITDTIYSMRTIMFTQPYTATTNYAIVIRPANSTVDDNIFQFYVNDIDTGQVTDENLSSVKSNYYSTSGGNWVSIPMLTSSATDFPGGPYDFEGIIAPIISYNFQTNFNITPSSACDGDTIIFTNTSDPAFVTNHRMYNFQAFSTYFNSEPDSTFAWDLGLTPTTLQWGASIPPYVYPSAGTYTVNLYYIGGLVGSCQDQFTNTITVNQVDDATFTYSGSTFCVNGPNQTPTVNTPGGTFTATPGGMMINSSTGEIDLTQSSPGNYVVQYTTSGACPNSSTLNISIVSTPDASFTYAMPSYCLNNSTNPTPIFTTGTPGVFSSSPSMGITLNPTTGVIDLANSMAGTYTITNTISGSGCPTVTANQTITLNAAPSISISPASPSICNGDSVSLSASGASTYTWSPSSGLSSTTGASVTANPTTTTTYTVNGTDANGCSNTSSVTITVNSLPNVTFTLSNSNVCVNNPTFTLSGGSPAGGTYSGPGVSAGQFDPSAAGIGTHTITYTYTDGNGCTGSATQTITVNSCTGVNESSIQNSLLIAPNPVKEQLLISFNNITSNNAQVKIFSTDGKLVYSENAAAASQYVKYIDVNSFAKGVYFVEITSEEGMIHNKIIVQ